MPTSSDLPDIEPILSGAGMSAEQAKAKQALLIRCQRAIESISIAAFAPGRIEFLGKHTDYCGGRSLLCTIDRGIIVAAAPRADNLLRILEISTSEKVQFAITADLLPRANHWSNYPMTVARRLSQNFGELRGADIAIASDLPQAAGLSSSSALVVAIFLILSEINRLPHRPAYQANIVSLEDLSGYLGCVENGQNFKSLPGDRGVGTFGGSQDHTAILCSRSDALVQYRFAPVVRERIIAFPGDYLLAVGVSGVMAEKAGNARDLYNQISLRASEILCRWNTAAARNDATLAAAVHSSASATQQIRQMLTDSPLELERFNQFLEESDVIVPRAGDALMTGELAYLGQLVDRSQAGAERSLHNQIDETIFLAAAARSVGAVAASALGAGFGGSVWAMISARNGQKFLDTWQRVYRERFPQHAARCLFFLTRPGMAARLFR